MVLVKCQNPGCNKEFKTTLCYIKRGGGKFCSPKCYHKSTKKKIIRKCQNCGEPFETYLSRIKIGRGKFCSPSCANSKENHHNWQGGKSFEPYCILFNNEFKERVRNFWDRKCGISGVKEKEEKLSVHHVNYDKQSCCNTTVPLFIPLSRKYHIKTNNNRDYWEEMLTNYIMIWFNGECYLK
jgi:hypothetical protein